MPIINYFLLSFVLWNAFTGHAQQEIKEIKLLEEDKNQSIKDIQFYEYKKYKITFDNGVEKYGTIKGRSFRAEPIPQLPKFHAPLIPISYDINPDFSIQLLWKKDEVLSLAGHATEVLAVFLHAEKDLLLTAGADNTLKIWNLRTCQLKETIPWPQGNLQSVYIAPAGDNILVQTTDNKLYLWKPAALAYQSIFERVTSTIQPILLPMILHNLRASL